MGVVYEAEQTTLHRHVALKVLRFGAVADEDAMNRFRREAETVARLHHTNIVPIFAVGCERGVHYYARQFIDGRSLADVLRQRARGANPGRPLLYRQKFAPVTFTRSSLRVHPAGAIIVTVYLHGRLVFHNGDAVVKPRFPANRAYRLFHSSLPRREQITS
jgi:serine/threonine protein kinase